jgi:Ca2+-binding RTX toxin-like protein
MAFVRGTNRLDRLIGTNDSDFIIGTDDSDFIFSLAGDDVVDGRGGDDFLIGGLGNDLLEGGPGADLLVDSTKAVSGGPLTALRISNQGNGPAIQDDDVMNGGDGDDVLISAAGEDTMNGEDGNDLFLITGPGLKIINGGAGDDVVVGPNVSVLAFGPDAPNVNTSYEFDGGDGNDTLEVSAKIVGTDFATRVGDTQIFFSGGDGNDTLEVRGLFAGNLTFLGGAGDDSVTITVQTSGNLSGMGEGTVQLGDGNDTLEVDGLWNLTVFGGAGDDSVVVSFPRGDPAKPVATGPVFGGAGDDSLTEKPPFELVRPTGEKLFFSGGDGNDVLTGGGSDNFVEGGAGRDILDGGLGDDHLDGGAGPDSLTGGPGNDKFVFGNPEEGPDSVHDFTPGVDQILVSASTFGGGLAPGALPADQFVAGSDPLAVGGQGVFLYDIDDGALAWDADGGGGNPAITIATLLNQPALSASDFVIF